jgi:nicotinamidase-related amidase
VGPHAGLGVLADAARRKAIPNIARLLPVVRSAGVRVVHCVVHRRPDGLGANHSARLFKASRRLDIAPGTPGGSVIPELGPDAADVMLSRFHGVGPMGGTELDAILRNLGITTIVPVGVSVNIAITNLVMDAVNAGYMVVLPRDAVAGVPGDYADAIIDNTLSLLSTITSTDELISAWSDSGSADGQVW